MPNIVVLSGPICSGKSELAKRLKSQGGFEIYSTSARIKEQMQDSTEGRGSLQEASKDLDGRTNYGWIATELASQADDKRIVVDSARFPQQISRIRQQFGWRVVHIHLSAPTNVLKERFSERAARKDIGMTFDEAMADETEQNSNSLESSADLFIDTSRSDNADIYIRVAARLGMFAPPDRKYVDVLIGSQFGSEGKGQVAAYLAREYDVVMRVGGPNAGHRVSSETGQFTYMAWDSVQRDQKA